MSGLILAVILGFPAAHGQAQTSVPRPADEDALFYACAESLACTSHLKRANQLYEQNIYAAALDEYQAAYVLQPYPLILYNIARIYHKQNRLSEAVAYYERYLDTGHGARSERARQLRSEAMQELDRQELLAEPPPARIDPQPLLTITPGPALAARRLKKPVYKQWWFWTLLGVATAGVATAVGLGVYARDPDLSGLAAKTFPLGK